MIKVFWSFPHLDSAKELYQQCIHIQTRFAWLTEEVACFISGGNKPLQITISVDPFVRTFVCPSVKQFLIRALVFKCFQAKEIVHDSRGTLWYYYCSDGKSTKNKTLHSITLCFLHLPFKDIMICICYSN